MSLTLVSCFYKMNSPHSLEEYLQNGTYLIKTNIPLVFFSNDVDILEWVKKEREDRPTRIELLPFEDTLFYKDRESLQKNMSLFTISNINKEKDHLDYILLQNNKMDFVSRVCRSNPFQSETIFWIDFGIQHTASASPAVWGSLETSIVGSVQPNKITQLKIAPVRKQPEQSWKDFFSTVYHHMAGGLFGGHVPILLEYAELFQSTWRRVLDEGWFQLDEAVMTMVAEEYPDKFSFFYGDYDGILCNLPLAVRSFPLLFQNIQYYLDKHLYQNASDILSHINPSALSTPDFFRFLDLYIQTDFYLHQGNLSPSLKKIFLDFSIPSAWFFQNKHNLSFYKNDPDLLQIMISTLSSSSILGWKEFKQKNPKIIYVNHCREFPFLSCPNLLGSFQNQFEKWGNSKDICSFYELVETPTKPIAFLWSHPPPNDELEHLVGYFKRNFPLLEFCFVCLFIERPPCSSVYSFLAVSIRDENEIIKAWVDILSKS